MLNGSINFDSSSMRSIRAMVDKINEVGIMLTGTTEDGELITYAVEKSDETEDDYDVLHTIVSQKNGWIRHNYYYPDHRVEEIYSHM